MIRLPMKPGKSATLTGVLPNCSARAFTAAKVSSLVAKPLITSTNFITGAGLKKCIPITLSARFVVAPTAVTGKEDVFVPRIV